MILSIVRKAHAAVALIVSTGLVFVAAPVTFFVFVTYNAAGCWNDDGCARTVMLWFGVAFWFFSISGIAQILISPLSVALIRAHDFWRPLADIVAAVYVELLTITVLNALTPAATLGGVAIFLVLAGFGGLLYWLFSLCPRPPYK